MQYESAAAIISKEYDPKSLSNPFKFHQMDVTPRSNRVCEELRRYKMIQKGFQIYVCVSAP